MGKRVVCTIRDHERPVVQPPSERWLSQTATESESRYAVRDVKRARDASELMRRAGYPSTSGMTRLVNHGGMINNPVTADEIRRGEEIWGPDPASLQGKITGHSSPQVQSINPAPIPAGQLIQELHCEIMFVDGVGLMVGIAKPMQLTIVVPVASKTGPCLKRAILQIIDALPGSAAPRRSQYHSRHRGSAGSGAKHPHGEKHDAQRCLRAPIRFAPETHH
mmetsp:Transcript_17751/g.47232  ORF Transcript_17751/g.47232 Transcript_17751/m.47232 type:complete len:221 (-) Transcript_17751:460-1122(-)